LLLFLNLFSIDMASERLTGVTTYLVM